MSQRKALVSSEKEIVRSLVSPLISQPLTESATPEPAKNPEATLAKVTNSDQAR